MKRNILARRAASAALAACMMFSLSAPALAASTDALLQQSTAAKNAVSVLGEKNGTLMIGNSSFDTETNINELELGGGTISYDAETHTLTLNGVNIEDSSHDWVIDFNDMDTLLNLVLVGKNILEGHGGISAPKLKISGNGSLQITATDYEGIAGAGQSEENLTIGSDVDITAMNGCAIVFNGSVRIEQDATVKAKCRYSGIDCYDLTIDSATEVNLESTEAGCKAINVHRDTGGTVAGTANIKNSKLVLKSAYPAFYAEGGIKINGGSVKAESTSDAGYDASSAAGGAIAAVAVGGAAIWGGYEIATRVILHSLLPEDAAIPANRGQLALLVWNTAGRPEPAGAPAFADVADPDMAKAAQWCTEQGTMDAKGDCFEPEGWTPKFKVIEVWNKAFPKQ
ncbi:MAG: hypothetical protein ACLR7P_09355 [Faecalibacterium sp.]